MLQRNTDMRVEAATLAAEARQLRIEGRRAIRNARRLKDKGQEQGSNVSDASVCLGYLNYNNIYLERMLTRREARLHHLARMMLKGKDYCDIEPITYEQVNAVELYERVWQWEPSVTPEFCAAWLNYDEELG